MEKRLSFVHSPQIYYEQNQGTRFIPLWAYTLASYVPSDWKISIVDCTVSGLSEIAEADVFALSGINQDFEALRNTQRALKTKYPNAKFLLGGPITWSFEKDGRLGELDCFDHLFILDGEAALPDFLNRLSRSSEGIPKIVRAERFSLGKAQKIRFDLLQDNARHYYGGLVEVSRGCPFLCEFCDIRVLPQNNEAHNKDPKLIVEEIEGFYNLGIRQIQLACDNFIGDIAWARKCVDEICAWMERTGARVALYTWLTVNVSKVPDLMIKMRKAGFGSLFIGVESFNANSILETAKIQNQNEKNQMIEALREIQSYGFMVIPGLIFGFDSDRPSLFEDTLSGVLESGLIGGDPTFLLALPGTPLYERMKRTGRLIEYREGEDSLGLHKARVSKVETNIRYLQPRNFLIQGFMDFIKKYTSASFMAARFQNHAALMMDSKNFISAHSVGYGNLREYMKFQFSSFRNISKLLRRAVLFLRPDRFWAVLRSYALVLRYRRKYPGLKNHFSIWLFLWSNLLIKYQGLKPEHFKIHSVEEGYDLGKLWQEADYESPELLPGGRNSEGIKVSDQRKRTREALLRLKDSLKSVYNLGDFKRRVA